MAMFQKWHNHNTNVLTSYMSAFFIEVACIQSSAGAFTGLIWFIACWISSLLWLAIHCKLSYVFG